MHGKARFDDVKLKRKTISGVSKGAFDHRRKINLPNVTRLMSVKTNFWSNLKLTRQTTQQNCHIGVSGYSQILIEINTR